MTLLTWLLGVFVLLLGIEYTRAAGTGWTAVWVLASLLWILAGVGLAVLGLVKLTTGKIGAGALTGFRSAKPPAPASTKEE